MKRLGAILLVLAVLWLPAIGPAALLNSLAHRHLPQPISRVVDRAYLVAYAPVHYYVFGGQSWRKYRLYAEYMEWWERMSGIRMERSDHWRIF